MVLYTISGQVTEGGSPLSATTLSLSGTTAAGTNISQTTTSDANGDYSLMAAVAGNWTVTPSLAGESFAPGFYEFSDLSANQTADFVHSSSAGGDDWNGFWGLPINSSATPSGTGCSDISGTWTESDQYGSSTWNLTDDTNGNVSGTVDYTNGGSCGTITYQTVTGSQSNGVFTLTASNPTALQDACGYPIAPTAEQNVTLSTSGSCSSGSANWSSKFGSGTSTWQGQVPTSLSVQNVHVYSYDEEVAAGYDPGCGGIVIGITYQLMDQKSPPQPIKIAGLVPQEQVINGRLNGVYMGDALPQFVDMYPSRNVRTNANGVFTDAPFGACDIPPSTAVLTDTQNIRIVNPKNAGNWVVRTNNWTYKGPSPGHGSVTNGVDITAQH